MPERVENKRAHLREPQSLAVLLLDARRFNVSALGRRGPDVTLQWPSASHPARFQSVPDPWSHGKHSPRHFRFSVRNQQRSIAAIHPSDGIPQEPIALFWAKAGIHQHGCDLRQQRVRRCEIPGFFFRRDYSLSVRFSGKYFDLGHLLKFSPFLCHTKNAAKDAKGSIDRRNFIPSVCR